MPEKKKSPSLNSSEVLRQQISNLKLGTDVSNSDALPAETLNEPVNADSVTSEHMPKRTCTPFLQYFYYRLIVLSNDKWRNKGSASVAARIVVIPTDGTSG
jgi:hypothetical protein